MCRSCARKPSGFSTEVDPRIMSLPVFLDSSCTARISLLVTPPATNTIRRRPCDIDPSPNPCMAPRIPDGALAASVALPLRAQDGADRLVRALVMRKPSRLPKSSLSSGSLIGLACQQHQHTAMKARSRAEQQQLRDNITCWAPPSCGFLITYTANNLTSACPMILEMHCTSGPPKHLTSVITVATTHPIGRKHREPHDSHSMNTSQDCNASATLLKLKKAFLAAATIARELIVQQAAAAALLLSSSSIFHPPKRMAESTTYRTKGYCS